MRTIKLTRSGEKQIGFLLLVLVISFTRTLPMIITYLLVIAAIIIAGRRFYLNYKEKQRNKQFYLLPIFLGIWVVIQFTV